MLSTESTRIKQLLHAHHTFKKMHRWQTLLSRIISNNITLKRNASEYYLTFPTQHNMTQQTRYYLTCFMLTRQTQYYLTKWAYLILSGITDFKLSHRLNTI